MFWIIIYLRSHYEIAENEKIAIYAHWAHLNKTKTVFPDGLIASLGRYIDMDYSEKYYVIGMYAGNGTITHLTRSSVINTAQLSEPVLNSIEYICLNAGIDSAFIDANDFPKSVYLRDVGTPIKNCNNFFLINPARRMDAVFFVKESKGGKMSENSDPSNDQSKRFYDIFLKEMKRTWEINNR